MKSPNNRGERIPPVNLSSPNEASGTRNCLHLIELLAKRVSWESTNKLSVDTKTNN